jgi:hypothetical protein
MHGSARACQFEASDVNSRAVFVDVIAVVTSWSDDASTMARLYASWIEPQLP